MLDRYRYERTARSLTARGIEPSTYCLRRSHGGGFGGRTQLWKVYDVINLRRCDYLKLRSRSKMFKLHECGIICQGVFFPIFNKQFLFPFYENYKQRWIILLRSDISIKMHFSACLHLALAIGCAARQHCYDVITTSSLRRHWNPLATPLNVVRGKLFFTLRPCLNPIWLLEIAEMFNQLARSSICTTNSFKTMQKHFLSVRYLVLFFQLRADLFRYAQVVGQLLYLFIRKYESLFVFSQLALKKHYSQS